MPIKRYKPTTPTLRYKTTNSFDQITTDKPYKPLLKPKKRSGGTNNNGRITVRHRGGGHKRHYRIVDFKRNKYGIPGKVETIEYDPNRSAFIALVKYTDGERRYILATVNMKVNDTVISDKKCEIREGNHLMMENIPAGTFVHNIEYLEGKGGQISRGAGACAEILAKEDKTVQIRMPSSEIRNFRKTCYATIGQVSNTENESIVLGSAGRKRWLGRRPKVRGVAMNPVDHPMGGGEGKASGGGHPVSPWGKQSKGKLTRKKNKLSNKNIVRRRRKKKR